MKFAVSLFTQSNLSRRVAVAFLMALILIASGFVLSFYSYTQYGTDSERVQQTYQTINTLNGVLSTLKDVETGTRGFLLSGDSLFLETYYKAAPAIENELANLEILLSGEAQHRLLDTLRHQVQAQLDMSTTQIRNRRDVRAFQSHLLLGKLRMDAVRRTVALMVSQEDKQMKIRNEQAAQSYQRTLLIGFLLSLITLFTVIFAYSKLDAELLRRQRTEDQLRAYEEELQAHIRQLTMSNEELERFAFIASHDLQEPLRKIQSFAGLVNERNKAVFDNDTNVFMSKIVNSASRMSRMIKDLLDFSRVSSQHQGFQLTKLNDVIDRVLEDMELQVKGLRAEIQVGPLPVLPVIATQMEQVFANLISNALKYRKPDQAPVVHITSEEVDGVNFPGLMPGKRYYKISVSDNGIGFDEKYTEHIFQLFQRLHAKTAYDGTGIGLAVCKRIILAHQGYIAAHGQPNEGATFWVVLPEKQPLPDYERSADRSASAYFIG